MINTLSFALSFGRMDVKTVFPPTNTVCGGITNVLIGPYLSQHTVILSYNMAVNPKTDINPIGFQMEKSV